MSVTYQKLAARIQKLFDNSPDLPQLNQQQLIALISHIFLCIGDALASGEDVYLDGFGRFYPGIAPPRKVNTPISGESETGFRIKIKFNSFKALEEQVEAYLQEIGLSIETKEKKMPLPHLKRDNNMEYPEFKSVEDEMNRVRGETHPYTPARDVPNVGLDKADAGSDEDQEASD